VTHLRDARAAVLLDEGTAPRLVDVQVRAPVGDEVLVRVDAVGICHTDVSVAARWPGRKLPMVFAAASSGSPPSPPTRWRAQPTRSCSPTPSTL